MNRSKPMKVLVACTASAVVALTMVAWPANGYRKHLCGLTGTELSYRESCPGISPPHRWRSVVGYRNDGSRGIDMCVIIKSAKGKYKFSRCRFYATSIYIRPGDLANGRYKTRAYNKNNNVFIGTERRYLYATTTRN